MLWHNRCHNCKKLCYGRGKNGFYSAILMKREEERIGCRETTNVVPRAKPAPCPQERATTTWCHITPLLFPSPSSSMNLLPHAVSPCPRSFSLCLLQKAHYPHGVSLGITPVGRY